MTRRTFKIGASLLVTALASQSFAQALRAVEPGKAEPGKGLERPKGDTLRGTAPIKASPSAVNQNNTALKVVPSTKAVSPFTILEQSVLNNNGVRTAIPAEFKTGALSDAVAKALGKPGAVTVEQLAAQLVQADRALNTLEFQAQNSKSAVSQEDVKSARKLVQTAAQVFVDSLNALSKTTESVDSKKGAALATVFASKQLVDVVIEALNNSQMSAAQRAQIFSGYGDALNTYALAATSGLTLQIALARSGMTDPAAQARAQELEKNCGI